MFGKSIEYWAVLGGMVLYVMSRDAETESVSRRIMKTAASAFLSYGLSPTIAPWTWDSEVVAAIAIMAFALIILDTMTALLMDRAFIKDLIRRRLGQKGDDDA